MGLEFLNLEQLTLHTNFSCTLSIKCSCSRRLSAHTPLCTHCRNTVHSHLEGTGDIETESVTHIDHTRPSRHFNCS